MLVHGRPPLAIIALVSCIGCAAETPAEVEPRLYLVSGANVTDTIDAVLPTSLVVQLRGAGGKGEGAAAIEFSSLSGTGPPLVLLAAENTQQFRDVVVVTTDDQGRASARVRLGGTAGPVSVRIQVANNPQIGIVTQFTVASGSPVGILTAPTDTTIYRGKSYRIEARATDRHGNESAGSLQYSALTPAVIGVDQSGTANALGVGRGQVVVAAGQISDTVYVSVPPEGVITAVRVSGTQFRVRIVMLNLDGTAEASQVDMEEWAEAGFSWGPDGSLVYGRGLHDTNLFKLMGSATAPLLKAPLYLRSMAFPRHSRDGEWIYFNGRPGHQNCEIWRVRADGTNPELVGSLADDYSLDTSPDPSPDGTRLVYTTSRVYPTMPVIRVITLASRAISPIDVPGVTPRWTPDGSRIAYISIKPSWGYLHDNRVMIGPGFLSMMDPDGRNQRVIPAGAQLWSPHFDLSPDGKYVIARSSADLLEIVDVATGEAIPLPYSRGMLLPAWQN